MEQQAVVLDKRNEALEQQNDDLAQKTLELCGQVQMQMTRQKDMMEQLRDGSRVICSY